MKYLMPGIVGAAMVSCCLLTQASAEGLPPGQVDFGAFSPPETGGEFVEVNLPGSLIAMAARFVEKQQPDVAQLIGGLHLVHVNVIGMDDSNRQAVEKRTERIRHELDSKGWERIVAVHQSEQTVSVYLKTANKDTVQGLVVMVLDARKQAVFVNVVGDIKPEQLAALGERLHLDPLKQAGQAVEKAEDTAERK